MLSPGKEMTIFAGKVGKHIWMSKRWKYVVRGFHLRKEWYTKAMYVIRLKFFSLPFVSFLLSLLPLHVIVKLLLLQQPLFVGLSSSMLLHRIVVYVHLIFLK